MPHFSSVYNLPSLEKTLSKVSVDSGKSGLNAAAPKEVTFVSSPTSVITEAFAPVSPAASVTPTPALGPVGGYFTTATAAEESSSVAERPVPTSHSYYKQDWKALGVSDKPAGPVDMPTFDAAKIGGEEQVVSANDDGKTKAETEQWIDARASKPECFNTAAEVHAFIHAGVRRLPPIVLKAEKAKEKKTFSVRAKAFTRRFRKTKVVA